MLGPEMALSSLPSRHSTARRWKRTDMPHSHLTINTQRLKMWLCCGSSVPCKPHSRKRVACHVYMWFVVGFLASYLSRSKTCHCRYRGGVVRPEMQDSRGHPTKVWADVTHH